MIDIEKLSREVIEEVEGRIRAEYNLEPRGVCDSEVTRRLEHSLLAPDAKKETIDAGCALALKYGIAALCVSPYYVSRAYEKLYGTRVAVCAAVGFPHGAMSTAAKIAEIRECTNNGATELDVAVNILAVKSGDFEAAEYDLREAVATAGMRARVKAVFEHGVFDEKEKEKVLGIIGRSGAEFVKIQNMLSGVGARVEDVDYVRKALGDSVKIKIDGGVKTLAQAKALFAAGADRIGLTATEAIAVESLSHRNEV